MKEQNFQSKVFSFLSPSVMHTLNLENQEWRKDVVYNKCLSIINIIDLKMKVKVFKWLILLKQERNQVTKCVLYNKNIFI